MMGIAFTALMQVYFSFFNVPYNKVHFFHYESGLSVDVKDVYLCNVDKDGDCNISIHMEVKIWCNHFPLGVLLEVLSVCDVRLATVGSSVGEQRYKSDNSSLCVVG